jgi:hypothetical protein
VAGDARALGADRALGDLHDDVLALFEHVADRGLARDALRLGAALLVVRIVRRRRTFGTCHLVEIFFAYDVFHMKEGRTIESDVDERCLHARKHARDLTQVDVSYRAAISCSFDVKL